MKGWRPSIQILLVKLLNLKQKEKTPHNEKSLQNQNKLRLPFYKRDTE